MAEVIGRLREEHMNMALLLDLMDQQTTRFQHGADLNFSIVRGIISYFLSFPDLYHHPREDRIVHKLRARAPEEAADLEALLNSHQHLASLTRRFATATIDQMVEPGDVSRRWFGSLARDFVDTNRQHMAIEEDRFFPLVLQTLTEKEWAELDADAWSGSDPLFGGRVERHFRTLFEAIMELDRANASGKPT